MGKIVYVVTEEATGAPRLVRAQNKTQAIGFVARKTYSANRATQEQLIVLVAKGLSVEDAVEREQPAA